MCKKLAASKCSEANPPTPTTSLIPLIQATTIVTDKTSNHSSSPRKPSILNNYNTSKSLALSSIYTSEPSPTELHATGTASFSYIAPRSQPRTKVQADLYFERKLRRLLSVKSQRGDEDEKSVVLDMADSESSAFASGKGAHWAALPEEVEELAAGTREAVRRKLREGRRRVVQR